MVPNSFSGCYVILHIRPGPPSPDPASTPQIATDGRFELSTDIWIERLDKEFAIKVQAACEPANHLIDNHVWDRHLYAFIRRIPPNESPRHGDLNELHTIIALSRLIHPTSVGERYCARIMTSVGLDLPIQAISLMGICPDIFIGDNSCDWLSPADGLELRKLVPWIPASKAMHKRVHRAFWNHEQAMRTYYLDMRWNLVVSGLEALVTVEDHHVRKQFVRRVTQLAEDCGMSFNEDELHDAYTLRSQLAHAQAFLYDLHNVLPPGEHKPLYDKLESLLRAVVRRCLLDEAFGQHFASASAVAARFP